MTDSQGVNQNTLKIDSNIDNRERTGSFSSILRARDDTKSNVSQQAQNLHETTTAMGRLNAQMQEFIKSLDEANNEVKKSQAYKDFSKEFKNFTNQFNDARVIVNRGSTNIEQLTKNVEKSNNAFDAMSLAYDEMVNSYNEETKTLKELSKAKRKQLEYDKADLRNRKEIRAMQSKQIIADAREGNKSATKALSKAAGETQKLLTNLKTAINLGQILKSTGLSDSAKIQLNTMMSMGLSHNEFNSFKRGLYDQIDTEVYTSEQVKSAIASLKDIGINSKEEALSKFDTIIKGQQLLGLTADQQAKLQALGNKTGRDELTFTTNKMAKWMSMSTNIGQKQLSELVELNTAFKAQFADLGISSEAFSNSTDSATAALMALTGEGSWATKYTDILTSLATNPDALHSALGMDAGTFKKRLENGETLTSMISSSSGTFNKLYRDFLNNPEETEKYLSYSAPAMGIDTNTQALLRLMAEKDRAGGVGSFDSYLKSFDVDGADAKALKNLEKAQKDATSKTDRFMNKASNWLDKHTDWVTMSKLDSYLTAIIGWLTAIASIDTFSGLGNLFGGKGKIAGAGNSAKFFAKAGSGGPGIAGSGIGTTMLGVGSIAAGTAWMGIDAYNGFNQTSKEMYGENANTGQKIGSAATAAVSGSKVHKTSKGNVDMGQNIGRGALSGAGKGALIGAGIGAFVPVLGPLVGGAIGAGIGALAGGFGGWWKSKKAQEQEQRDKEKVKAEKEIAANTGRTNSLLGANLSLATRKTASVRSYTGIGSPSAAPISHTNTGGMGASYPWPISSPFGPRTLGNGDSSFHNGVDWGISEGTPIGAPVSGTITRLATDGRNTYYNSHGLSYQQRLNAGLGIYLAGSDGRTYQFWHLSKLGVKQGQSVKAGDTIGLSGNSGYSTGPHLHYGVQVNGAWIDPISNNLAPAALFSASGAKLVEVDIDGTDSSSSSSDSSDYAKASTPTQKVYQNKIRRFSTYAGAGMGAVVDGLADIKQTLIDLSNRQTQDEQILQMLQGSRKQEPRRA